MIGSPSTAGCKVSKYRFADIVFKETSEVHVKNIILASAAALCVMAAAVQAQESRSAVAAESPLLASAHGLPTSIGDWAEAPAGFPEVAEPGREAQEGRGDDPGGRPQFSLGPVAGYIRARDADRGTWFGGIQARMRFMRFFAVEGSITFHQDEYQDGDVVVTQYPVQLTALFFPFPDSQVRPYGLVGAGWYYTRFQYDGLFSAFKDETDRLFGVHVGAGVEVDLDRTVSIFADFRWIFLDEPNVDNSQIEDEEFDSGQLTLGLSVRF